MTDLSLWAIGRLVVVDRVRKLLTIEVHPDYPESIPDDRLGGPVSLFIGDRPPTGIAARERERVMAEVRAAYLEGEGELHTFIWPSEDEFIAAGGYASKTSSKRRQT